MSSVGAASDTPAEPSLDALLRAQFTLSKKWWEGAIVVRTLAGLIGLGGLFIPEPTVTFVLAVIAGVASILAHAMQIAYEHEHSRGERLRRQLLFSEGLGRPISASTEEKLRREIGTWAVGEARKNEFGAYFQSDLPPGSDRLLEHILENVHWGRDLHYTARNVAFGVLVVFVTGTFFALLFLARSDTPVAARELGARVFLVVAIVFVSSGLARMWWAYNAVASRLEKAETRIEALLDKGGISVEEALREMEEYDIQMARAQQIPDPLYKWRRPRLNASWNRRRRRSSMMSSGTEGAIP